ncbi:MAG TPA: thioredoxin [Candidatus Paceibacterota bacterium]|jgi:thioredoxin 1|nr:thioredoxin [Candidatus Paceibacterota bacterium]HOA47755.1 thioredoxin [Candidatus Pacearchaeota archaeon]HPZ75069.1 thioredoxin [Candidatus Pacearchaeota archaeon]HQD89361.1 thioredoxin [Candidatus Pacearchaeota archaeon]HRR39449.1 thioredoxin [Candidatus Paceibacterota bacterium]
MFVFNFTDQNFEKEVFKSQKPVLVDFWAEWCMPCKMMSPIIEEIADEFNDRIKVGKLNIDENPFIATTFSIDAIPTLILFKNGKVVQRIKALQPKEVIEEMIHSVIKEN